MPAPSTSASLSRRRGDARARRRRRLNPLPQLSNKSRARGSKGLRTASVVARRSTSLVSAVHPMRSLMRARLRRGVRHTSPWLSGAPPAPMVAHVMIDPDWKGWAEPHQLLARRAGSVSLPEEIPAEYQYPSFYLGLNPLLQQALYHRHLPGQ